jgi:hypothetical protein
MLSGNQKIFMPNLYHIFQAKSFIKTIDVGVSMVKKKFQFKLLQLDTSNFLSSYLGAKELILTKQQY